MRRKLKAARNDPPMPWEDRPVSRERYERNRTAMLRAAGPGLRPLEWWIFEVGRRDKPEHETRALYEMGLLQDEELAQCLRWWRTEFATAMNSSRPSEHFVWRGIPAELRKRWRAEHKRRSKTPPLRLVRLA